ncbi:hypothetical protein L207DRAFT_536869 [Hyaloscypha variabilis F]|uniref:Uncharacterized protein n=1 Tax=Hyaloscypha variabilis (strain UAMH 11265 / GT02V1 / F) TaxID=1149755 RepID=A0A2J6R083_HYAVF|nr:hypothetical protein L207DRAFT_536869 [Hyaloscypha variabilis F]
MVYQSQLGAIRAMLQILPSSREPTWTWERILSVHLPVMLAATRSQARFAGATNQDFFQYKAERQIWFHLWGQHPPAPPFPGIEPPMHLPVPRPPPPPPPVKSPEEQAQELYQAYRRYLATTYPGVDVDALIDQVDQTFTRMVTDEDGPVKKAPPPATQQSLPVDSTNPAPAEQKPAGPIQIFWASMAMTNSSEKRRFLKGLRESKKQPAKAPGALIQADQLTSNSPLPAEASIPAIPQLDNPEHDEWVQSMDLLRSLEERVIRGAHQQEEKPRAEKWHQAQRRADQQFQEWESERAENKKQKEEEDQE